VKTIGFIGLGIMGGPMARNLLRAGFRVVAHSRTRAKVDALAVDGAQPAANPAEVARHSDALITMVPDTPDVRQVLLGESGVIEGAAAGLVVIDMSTISPTATREMAQALAQRGVQMLDAPVSGGEIGAINAKLSIMVGGDAAVFERCRAVLAALGDKITYVGPQGHGQITKLCNQVAGVLSLQAVAEALLLATKAGVDPHKVIEALSGGAADSWNLRVQGPKMLQRDFAAGFFVHLQQKDLRLAMQLAGELSAPLPGAALVQQLFNAVEAHGGGKLGVQALVLALEELAGMQVGGKPPKSA
jgi:2-hydroxy-3-oxopropionate reductase